MERRKFIIGAGALATGSSAAIGTGAVTSVRSDRSYQVDVAGDGDAYVGLIGNTDSPFVSDSGGTLSIDFASDTAKGGEGVNVGVTESRPAFTIKNQGSETLYIQLENPLSNNDLTTQASGNAASEASLTVPAGIDFQFIAVPAGDANSLSVGEFGVIGRNSVPSSGPTFGSTTGQQSIRKHPGATGYNMIEKAGYVKLTPGDSVDIIARVIASESILDEGTPSIPDTSFTVEAFSDSQRVGGESIFEEEETSE
ncbi:hypothetical protein [Halorubrum aethiopicum]|uniref:hypothetical protein n=1 Tax=Halorubrum aethiopicum TaxID=1758255 RepID=UPI0012FE9A74|nr:hypothetical protein [Halorubrum aethiopicum]